jgi:hypothetical protein
VHCSAGISNYFVFTIENHLPLHSFGAFPPYPLLEPATRLFLGLIGLFPWLGFYI